MRLIADGGSTKTEWVLLEGQRVVTRFQTAGFNLNYTGVEAATAIVFEAFPPEWSNRVDEINFYGSGCGNPSNRKLLKDIFLRRFPLANATVTHDLEAAAHALFGHEKGIACILGTGANSCLYDGNEIVETGVSLGFLVGDEGSGTDIGKSLARSYYYGLMPDDLQRDFSHVYPADAKEFVRRLYHEPQPNLFLSGFSKFAGKHKDHPFVVSLVSRCFEGFIEAFVCRFEGFKTLQVGFVGSVAACFQPILETCLGRYGIQLGPVVSNPCDGLIRYYQNKCNNII